MNKIFSFALALLISLNVAAQSSLDRPKLVVGIVVDQMRWDYLYRFYDLYDKDGGFKRMLDDGFTCENTLIPYLPTYTACGHSSIYTGSVPAINGITGNGWWDYNKMRIVTSVEDDAVNTKGSNTDHGQASPKNLLSTTIGDELRLATNFKSKVIGIALKDRASILPAGHSANAAYWYDKSNGHWISSSYYLKQLPEWVNNFNNQNLVDQYYKNGWKLLYAADKYDQSTADDEPYEGKPFGNSFPYDLSQYAGNDYSKIATTPMANELTIQFAEAAIQNEQLGADENTDLLTVSFSSPDYVGHTFGPNSVESEDDYLRLDKYIGSFLQFLDNYIGRNNYTVFLTADHGAAHVPEFLRDNKLPGGRIFMMDVVDRMNKELDRKYHIKDIILSAFNFQIFLNHAELDRKSINTREVIDWIITYLKAEPGMYRVMANSDMNTVPLNSTIREMLNNGYYPKRCGDIAYLFDPGYISAYSQHGTTHGMWNPYDAHIPLLWFGKGIKKGQTTRTTYMTDIAPTVAAMLKIQMPSGNIGHVISEVLKK